MIRFAQIALCAFVVLAVAGCPPGDNGDDSNLKATVTSHYILIKACDTVVDAKDPTSRKTRVPHGEWAVWINESNDDVTLEFGNVRKLFGVESKTILAGARDSLQVLQDAHPTDRNSPPFEHEYRPKCFGGTQPGPVIIVPPPGQGG